MQERLIRVLTAAPDPDKPGFVYCTGVVEGGPEDGKLISWHVEEGTPTLELVRQFHEGKIVYVEMGFVERTKQN